MATLTSILHTEAIYTYGGSYIYEFKERPVKLNMIEYEITDLVFYSYAFFMYRRKLKQ